MDKKKITPLSLDELRASHEQEEPGAILGKDFPQEKIDQWIAELGINNQKLVDAFMDYKSKRLDGYNFTESQMKKAMKTYFDEMKERMIEDEESENSNLPDFDGKNIPPLEKASNDDDYLEDGKLEYIKEFAIRWNHYTRDTLSGDDPIDPIIFAHRYHQGIFESSKMDFYIRKKIQMTLKAYNLHPVKFWYFILYLKDYVLDICDSEIDLEESCSDELMSLHDLIANSGYAFNDDEVNYQVTLDARKDGRKGVVITKTKTMGLLAYAIEMLMEQSNKNLDLNDMLNDGTPKKRVKPLSVNFKYNCFRYYLEDFLQSHKPESLGDTRYNRDIYSTETLISLIIYITRLGDDRFKTDESRVLHDMYDKDFWRKLNKTKATNKIYIASSP